MARDHRQTTSTGRANRLSRGTTRPLPCQPWLEWLEDRWLPSVFTVTNTADSGSGSLRQAIHDANANPGIDVIQFAIGSGHQTITPASPLPTLTDVVTIDATTQPGYAGTPLIELDGSLANGAGVSLTAGHSTVRGLVINRFVHGIVLSIGGHNGIEGNYLGTDVTGTLDLGNTFDGIFVAETSSNNRIGGTSAAARNVISGNDPDGIGIRGLSNVIQGNRIGTNAAETAPWANGRSVICLMSLAQRNRIGTDGNAIGDAWRPIAPPTTLTTASTSSA